MIYFIILLGVLIFIHELGHFLFAKIFGVRVLTFSIGFGPKILKYKRNFTEYCLSLFPLGGYVKMLGEDPSEILSEEDKPYAFNYKPLWKRFLIVFAGPFFNILLPVIIIFFLYFAQSSLPPSVIGIVVSSSPAEKSGLMSGDKIIEIDKKKIKYWFELTEAIEKKANQEITLKYERDGKIFETKVIPELYIDTTLKSIDIIEKRAIIGISIPFQKPVIYVEKNSPAEIAGLKPWDVVIEVNGKKIERFEELKRKIEENKEKPLSLTVIREKEQGSTVEFEKANFENPFTTTIYPLLKNGKLWTGIKSAEFFIFEVEKNSPAEIAGLQKGDEILTLNGKRFSSFDFLVEALRKEGEKETTLQIMREGEIKDIKIMPKLKKIKTEIGTEEFIHYFGAKNRTWFATPELIPNDKRISYAIKMCGSETLRKLKIILFGVWALLRGKIPLKDMGGPILIYDVAEKTSRYGWDYFFKIMIWLSINLAIINLFPIPILDGGHILLFTIEGIRRKPLSLKTIKIVNAIGLSILIGLMILVFKNDIERKWDDIVKYFK